MDWLKCVVISCVIILVCQTAGRTINKMVLKLAASTGQNKMGRKILLCRSSSNHILISVIDGPILFPRESNHEMVFQVNLITEVEIILCSNVRHSSSIKILPGSNFITLVIWLRYCARAGVHAVLHTVFVRCYQLLHNDIEFDRNAILL